MVKKAVDLWAKNRNKTHRLSQVHGDFYYNHIIFDEDRLTLFDKNRGLYGEPADDVTCILENYYSYALQQNNSFAGPFKELSEIFLNKYLELTKDEEILEVIPFYWITRSVIIFSPVFYPDLSDDLRRKMFETAMKLADAEKFSLDII